MRCTVASVCRGERACPHTFWHTVVLPKIPHCNSSKSVPNRPLRGRRGRFGTLLQQLECGIFGRTAVQPFCTVGVWDFWENGCTAVLYSRSPKNPALQLFKKSSKSASTTPQKPIWNTFGTVAVRDFWENGCILIPSEIRHSVSITAIPLLLQPGPLERLGLGKTATLQQPPGFFHVPGNPCGLAANDQ